jgi:RNA polymerase sigma-70 factor (ECF subfamily)
MAVASHSFQFPTTHWSWVMAAADRATPEARAALAALCEAYWFPIYALIRHRGHPSDQAADLVQDYFTRLLERPVIAAADRSKGRFRSFLRTDCQHFLLDQRRKWRVRANILNPVSIDAQDAEKRYRFEPADRLTPDRLFDRTWALTLLDRVLDLLGQEYAEKGQAEVFNDLKPALSQGRRAVRTAEVAARHGTTEAAVHTAVHRLKRRYRAILQREIAATLADPSEVDEEIRWLFEVIRS